MPKSGSTFNDLFGITCQILEERYVDFRRYLRRKVKCVFGKWVLGRCASAELGSVSALILKQMRHRFVFFVRFERICLGRLISGCLEFFDFALVLCDFGLKRGVVAVLLLQLVDCLIRSVDRGCLSLNVLKLCVEVILRYSVLRERLLATNGSSTSNVHVPPRSISSAVIRSIRIRSNIPSLSHTSAVSSN